MEFILTSVIKDSKPQSLTQYQIPLYRHRHRHRRRFSLISTVFVKFSGSFV